MKCPECVKEGKCSIVTERMSYSTAMHFPQQWDEDGNPLPRGQNTTTVTYTCSCGHGWRETR